MVWDHNNCMLEAENNLVMPMFTRMFPLMKRICRNLWEKSNQLFQNLKSKEKISDKQLVNTLGMSIKKFLT